MKKNLKFKISFFVSLSVILIAIVTSVVYAFISTTSTRGEIEVSAATITAETTYTSSTNSFAWTYEEAGDTKQINITTSNQAGVILHRFYNIELASGFTSNENLLKAIVVYYNDEYVGVLNDIINSNPDIQEEYNFIGLSSNKTDNFKFELHQAAINSIFDNKDIKITITTYTENADYYKYIFVKNETDFKKAIDDVNSGLFTEIPSIVLCNNITLENSYTISDPVKLYLNGSTLNGSLTINDTVSTNPDALLEVLGTGTFNVTVTLGSNYDSNGAITLVKNHIKEAVASGLAAGSTTNVLGYYSFYGITVEAVTRCTYTAPNVVIADTSNEYYNALGSIRVNNNENISFKILGTKTALLDETLAYMPEDGATITSDLFLPTYIPSQNANITWTSSDESIITSTGMITADRLENAEVTLYAEIKVNETIITRRYNFKVSAHNNEINFYKLVQEISPIVINNVRNSDSDDNDALYHLPIINVNSNGTFGNFDYRTSYQSPVNTKMFDWQAFKDIGLENITYSMELDSNDNIKYDYITLANGNELYLNTITLNNFARIVVTGDFGNHETYTTYVNISISVGSNTQLLEKAFTQVSEELETISVLGNILSTRIESGMKNEKGDFSLSHAYTDTTTNTVNEDYTIEYSGAEDIIDSITYNSTTDKYDFTINPEYFNEYETTVAFTATVYYLKGDAGQTSKSRTFYVTVPAALHISDFGTISIYNSTKYQVFNQLPSNEKGGTTGYTASGTLTDSNLNYILLRDIVGDANYLTQYDKGNGLYLTKINYTSSNYASGTESLSYQTASTNPTSTTDTAAYDFARLIEWATGNTRVAASTVVSNTSALGTYASKKANAEDYLNNDEIAVLKQYYISATSATEAQWNSLFSEVFNVAPGYIYTNPDLLNQVIVCIQDRISTYYNGNSTTSFSTIFGKYMEIIQRYAVSTTTVNKDDAAPCQQVYNTRYRWVESDSALSKYTYDGTSYNINYSVQLANGKYWNRYNYSGTTTGGDASGTPTSYAALPSDRTSYITENELTVLIVFWLNGVSAGNGSTTGLNTTFTSTQLNTIESILTADAGKYYSGFARTDFSTVGKAILNAFDACLEIPTYFATDGVAKIIKSFYDRKDYKLPSYDGTVTTSFVSSLNGSIPYITNADNIKSVLSYFVNLKTLTFNGDTNLAAFLSENGLSTVFARTGLYNNEITSLTMKHVAHSSVNFDLTNIKNFTKLTTLDLSNNSGIQSVNELVNVNRKQYTLVNIEQIGVEYEYQEFAIDNIASSTCTVRYTDAVGTNTYTNTSDNSLLSELSDFNKFISKYLYMSNVVYDESGSGTQIVWRIEEGNAMGGLITNAGSYPTVDSVSAMNQLVSPYYYCNEGFTYEYGNQSMTFTAGHLYCMNYSGGTLSFVDKGAYTLASTITDDLADSSVPNFTGYNPTYTKVTTSETVNAGVETVYSSITWYEKASQQQAVTITLKSFRIYYNPGNSNRYIYFDPNSNYLECTTTSGSATSFFFLTSEEVDNILNKSYSSSQELGVTPGWWPSNGSNNYYMCFINNNELNFVGTSTQSYIWPIYSSSKSDGVLFGLKNAIVDPDNNYLQIARSQSGYTPIFASENTYNSITIQDTTSINYTYNRVNNPYITIYYSNNTTTKIEAYSAGYEIIKVEDSIIDFTEVQSTKLDYKYNSPKYYYYIGPDTVIDNIQIKSNTIVEVVNRYVYPVVSRSRTYTESGAWYYWRIWYKTTSGSDKAFISSTNVSKVEYNNLTNTSTFYASTAEDALPAPNIVESYDERWDDWNNPLLSSWEFDTLVAYNYVSYVTNIANNVESTYVLDKKVTIYDNVNAGYNYIYKNTGTTGSENVYKENTTGTSTSYTNNSGYILSISDNVLTWNSYSGTITDDTGTTMDSILATANQHFKDYQYGAYYGKYYGYSGVARYISSGIYVRPGYVYRIMPNATNTAFEWVEVSTYTTGTSDEILAELGTGRIDVGDICYSTQQAGFGFFNSGWYKVILDEKTNVVNLVKFTDMNFITNGAETTTRLTNEKLVKRTGDYLGYSGTFTVQISAMIRVINNGVVEKEYIKTYKLKFVGSLYEG